MIFPSLDLLFAIIINKHLFIRPGRPRRFVTLY
jgi:hypothetical protein